MASTRSILGLSFTLLGVASGIAFGIFRLDERYDRTPAMLLAPAGLLLWCLGTSLLLYPLLRRLHWTLRIIAVSLLIPALPIVGIVVTVLLFIPFAWFMTG